MLWPSYLNLMLKLFSPYFFTLSVIILIILPHFHKFLIFRNRFFIYFFKICLVMNYLSFTLSHPKSIFLIEYRWACVGYRNRISLPIRCSTGGTYVHAIGVAVAVAITRDVLLSSYRWSLPWLTPSASMSTFFCSPPPLFLILHSFLLYSCLHYTASFASIFDTPTSTSTVIFLFTTAPLTLLPLPLSP